MHRCGTAGPAVLLSTYLGALAQVVADLHVAVVRRGQLLEDLLPLVGVCVGLLQAAELLVGRLEADRRSRGRLTSDSFYYVCTLCPSIHSFNPIQLKHHSREGILTQFKQ